MVYEGAATGREVTELRHDGPGAPRAGDLRRVGETRLRLLVIGVTVVAMVRVARLSGWQG